MAVVTFAILMTVGGIHNREVGCDFPRHIARERAFHGERLRWGGSDDCITNAHS
jgi:hypothetical protein